MPDLRNLLNRMAMAETSPLALVYTPHPCTQQFSLFLSLTHPPTHYPTTKERAGHPVTHTPPAPIPLLYIFVAPSFIHTHYVNIS